MPEQTPAVIKPYEGAIIHAPAAVNDTNKIINKWAALALFMGLRKILSNFTMPFPTRTRGNLNFVLGAIVF